MVINGSHLLQLAPIKDMLGHKVASGPGGTSYGLGEAGYDIRIAQELIFDPKRSTHWVGIHPKPGLFALASAMERFQMPDSLVAIVHDKSTWARLGLSVQNTVIEPGWQGHLTLEIIYYGIQPLTIPKGAGIAQVIFHQMAEPAEYNGKYQNQPNEPTPAR